MATPTSNGVVSPVTTSGTAAFNALLTGYKWGGPRGSGAQLTYSYREAYVSYYSTNPATGYGPQVSHSDAGEPWHALWYALPTAQKTGIAQGLARFSEVANVTFGRVTDSFSVAGDLRFGYTSGKPGDDTRPGWAYYPEPTSKAGDVWFNTANYSNLSNPVPGTFGFYTILHEIGHALGLKHTHEGSLTIPLAFDSVEYSVMSYRDYSGDNTNSIGSELLPETPMLYDIAALQYLYGANMSTRAGSTVYSWAVGEKIYETIWDAGGTDVIDWSNQFSDAVIDLHAGAFSEIGPARSNTAGGTTNKNLAIAFNVTIENANGGTGDDVLHGNDAKNVLDGRRGADAILGYGGDDTLINSLDAVAVAGDDVEHGGSPGYTGTGEHLGIGGRSFSFDAFNGGSGTDTLRGGSASEVLILEYADLDDPTYISIEVFDVGSGNDIVDLTSLRFTYGAATLKGGAGNDVLWANSGADTVDGGTGSDRMLGGGGNDTYIVDASGDVVRELSRQGTDTVRSSVSETLADYVENLVLTGSSAVSGNGNASTNILTGNNASNTLDGKSGTDILKGLGGNDTLVWGSTDSYDGGTGSDTLRIDGARMTLDLRSLPQNRILNTEIFNITGSGANKLRVTSTDVLDLSSVDTLRVDGNAGDIVQRGTGWITGSSMTIGANSYFRYTKSGATLLVDTDITSQTAYT